MTWHWTVMTLLELFHFHVITFIIKFIYLFYNILKYTKINFIYWTRKSISCSLLLLRQSPIVHYSTNLGIQKLRTKTSNPLCPDHSLIHTHTQTPFPFSSIEISKTPSQSPFPYSKQHLYLWNLHRQPRSRGIESWNPHRPI
jgi:hypothetical protein